ncbi:pyridoxamine 5'-phosphate oxidase family protein [Termitidicoccus mucosus]|uniref:Pyridoxamine 5'-phosphate oxidase-like domain-containing protein n=1 Tax=Termitidicoccus mucosus TaxID=1184151 RepID=A0A178IH02_9BACT|nr:hypothetical protein AW736_13665 [Opitutaceae bacterium TSB47]
MNAKKELEKIMSGTERIALASSVDNIPNVRILNFVYLEREKILYFASTKGDPKEKEFLKNNKVALTTIPSRGLSHVRIHDAVVERSKRSIWDLKNEFVAKMPWYNENIERNGDTLNLYEVHFSRLMLLAGPDRSLQIEL